MGVNGKRDETRYIIFQQKNEKQGGETGKTEEKTHTQKEKTGKNRKLQEIQNQDCDEVSGNAENGNKFST